MITKELKRKYADMGIRTPVAGVRGRHDWPLHYISILSFEFFRTLNTNAFFARFPLPLTLCCLPRFRKHLSGAVLSACGALVRYIYI